MAATTSTGEVRVWSLRSAPHVTSIPAHTGSIGRASISADGSVALTSSSGEGAAAAWDVATWKEITRVRSSDEFTISFGLIAPDGASFALGSRQGAVRLLDTRDARLLAEFRDLRRQPLACVFTEDSSRLIGATEPGQVVVWDARGGRLERELRASGADVLSLAAAGGQRSALGLRGGVIQVWDAAAAAVVHELTLPEGRPAFALAYSPDRTRVAVGGFNGSVDILDAATGRQLQSFQAHAQALYRLHFSPDGAVLASASRDEFGKLWEVATGRFLARVEERSATASPATNVLFIPGSPTLLVTYGSGTLEARDTTYPDHCIAGNVEHQLIRHAAELGAGVDEPRVREWVKSLGGRGTGK
jgi:WD40 repeat protein